MGAERTREEFNLDSEYQAEVDNVLSRAPEGIVPVVEELDRIATSIRAGTS